MRVELLSHTADSERIVAAAAKLCYSDSDIDSLMCGLSDAAAERFVGMLSDLGHESPVEHASFTFAIEGVSRTLLAQITRHRIASYSVQSQRYVKLDDFRYVTPPEIAADAAACERYQKAMRDSASAYGELTDILFKKHRAALIVEGKSEKDAEKAAEKRAIEDARFVLPGGCETKMIVTMNTRSLRNFFRLRCCSRAQWEIKALADEMLRIVCAIAPSLFESAGPSCVAGGCSEGKMSCGRANEMKEFYNTLKSGK